MPTNLLATGTGTTPSSDLVVTDPVTVALKDAAGDKVDPAAEVRVELKDDAGQYFRVDVLNEGKPAVVIVGPGTYRFVRTGSASVGVFSG